MKANPKFCSGNTNGNSSPCHLVSFDLLPVLNLMEVHLNLQNILGKDLLERGRAIPRVVLHLGF